MEDIPQRADAVYDCYGGQAVPSPSASRIAEVRAFVSHLVSKNIAVYGDVDALLVTTTQERLEEIVENYREKTPGFRCPRIIIR